MKSRAYRSVSVKEVKLTQKMAGREGQPVVVGMDIRKKVILVMCRWGDRDYSPLNSVFISVW